MKIIEVLHRTKVVLDEVADMLRQQAEEIERLKQNAEDCTCKGGHSEAYLKAKGRL